MSRQGLNPVQEIQLDLWVHPHHPYATTSYAL